MLLTLAEVLGPVAAATARCQSSMLRVTSMYSEMVLRMNTRIEGLPGRTAFGLSGPGSQNATESEIQRRQHTRIGAQANLVGVQNATERAMSAKALAIDALVGEALRGVGSMNRTQAEIYRRLAAAYIRLG